MLSATGPAVFAIAAPEGIRGNVQEGMEEVTSFSQQEYDKFLQGYKSQHKELSFWVEEDAITGTLHAQVCKSMHVRCLLVPLLSERGHLLNPTLDPNLAL